MILIIRETLPLLGPEDQETFVVYGAGRRHPGARRAIVDAWATHAHSFPNSKKRVIAILFVVAGSIAFLSYPIWHTLAN